jgi:hypothetical protein
MANEHAAPVGQSAHDYDEHERTFRNFVRLLGFGAAAVACILILLAIIAG